MHTNTHWIQHTHTRRHTCKPKWMILNGMPACRVRETAKLVPRRLSRLKPNGVWPCNSDPRVMMFQPTHTRSPASPVLLTHVYLLHRLALLHRWHYLLLKRTLLVRCVAVVILARLPATTERKGLRTGSFQQPPFMCITHWQNLSCIPANAHMNTLENALSIKYAG